MLDRFELLPPLAIAYGSVHRARVALDRALQRAELDHVPLEAAECTSFLCAQLHAVVTEDLGAMLAGALLDHLRNRVGRADEASPTSSRTGPVARVALRSTISPASQPRSGPRRRDPCVMLVRVKRGDEEQLGLAALGVRVVRVTHPLPACERMRVLRPSVVVAGPGIGDHDLDRLTKAAREVGIQIIVPAAFVGPAVVREVVRRAVVRSTAIDDDDLPESKPDGRGSGEK